MTTSNILAAHPDGVSGKKAEHRAFMPLAALATLFIANIYDPGGTFLIKYLAFFLAALFSVKALKHLDLSNRELATGLLLFITWPLWSLFYGVVNRGDVDVGLTQVTPFLFVLPLLLLLSTVDRRTPLRLFYACIFSLAIFVIVTFGLIFLMPDSAVSSRVNDFLTSMHEHEGYFGSELMGDVNVPVLYFRSTLFLVPACVYFLFVGRAWRASITFLALALTWSKSGMFIALAFGLVFLILKLISRGTSAQGRTGATQRFAMLRMVLPILLLSAVTVFILSSFPGFFDLISDTAAGQSETAVVRIGHYHSIMDLFLRNPDYLLIGQGAGTSFFSSGESDYVRIIELAHLDAIRKFGLPWFLGFSALVFYSSWRLIRLKEMEARGFGFALVSMYIAAGTNPVLLSPLFIILLMLCYFAQRTPVATSS